MRTKLAFAACERRSAPLVWRGAHSILDCWLMLLGGPQMNADSFIDQLRIMAAAVKLDAKPQICYAELSSEERLADGQGIWAIG